MSEDIQEAEWTIMVYMAGDNNLSEDMATAISDLQKEAPSLNKINVLAYYDTGTSLMPTKQFDFKATTLKEIIAGEDVLDDEGKIVETASSDPDSVRNFIHWCLHHKNRKAKKYALIISGHGDGFQQSSFMRDEEPLGNMTVHGLETVLRDFGNILGKPGEKLAILGFDTCVMGTIEVANQLKDTAHKMISSQGYVPSSGWSYAGLIQELKKLEPNAQNPNGQYDDDHIIKAVMCSFMNYSEDYARLTGRSTNIGTCDLSKIGDVMNDVETLGRILLESLRNEVSREDTEKVILGSHQQCQTFLYDQSVDIIDFCKILMSECDSIRKEIKDILAVAGIDVDAAGLATKFHHLVERRFILKKIYDACDELIQKVAGCVNAYNYRGADYQFSTGLSLFFPWSFTAYRMTETRYDNFSSATKNEWSTFLAYYLEKTMRKLPLFAQGEKVDPLTGRPKGDFNSQIERFRRTNNFDGIWYVKKCN